MYKHDDPCLKSAYDDERIFVLLARDGTAPEVVIEWIKLNIHRQHPNKLREALETALDMVRRGKEFRSRRDTELVPCLLCDGTGIGYKGDPVKNPLGTACQECKGTGKVRINV